MRHFHKSPATLMTYINGNLHARYDGKVPEHTVHHSLLHMGLWSCRWACGGSVMFYFEMYHQPKHWRLAASSTTD